MRLKHQILASAALSFALAVPALAADVIYDEPVAPVAPIASVAQNWTGFSVGVFVGGATGDADITSTGSVGGVSAADSKTADFTGMLGGVQLGYDQQFGSAVLGARASVAATNIETDKDSAAIVQSKLKYLGTAGVRAGVAVDKLLPYVHGGFAYGQTEQSASVSGFDASKLDKTSHTGWTAGAGAEYAITQQVSVGAEYGYVDLGEKKAYDGSFTAAGKTGNLAVDEDLKFHTFKAGVNFRF